MSAKCPRTKSERGRVQWLAHGKWLLCELRIQYLWIVPSYLSEACIHTDQTETETESPFIPPKPPLLAAAVAAPKISRRPSHYKGHTAAHLLREVNANSPAAVVYFFPRGCWNLFFPLRPCDPAHLAFCIELLAKLPLLSCSRF